jgi:hypothetical protein
VVVVRVTTFVDVAVRLPAQLAADTGTREGLKVQLLGVVGGEVSQGNLVKVLTLPWQLAGDDVLYREGRYPAAQTARHKVLLGNGGVMSLLIASSPFTRHGWDVRA